MTYAARRTNRASLACGRWAAGRCAGHGRADARRCRHPANVRSVTRAPERVARRSPRLWCSGVCRVPRPGGAAENGPRQAVVPPNRPRRPLAGRSLTSCCTSSGQQPHRSTAAGLRRRLPSRRAGPPAPSSAGSGVGCPGSAAAPRRATNWSTWSHPMANTGASKTPSESTCRPDRAGSFLPKQTESVAKQTKSLRRYVAVTNGRTRGSIEPGVDLARSGLSPIRLGHTPARPWGCPTSL